MHKTQSINFHNSVMSKTISIGQQQTKNNMKEAKPSRNLSRKRPSSFKLYLAAIISNSLLKHNPNITAQISRRSRTFLYSYKLRDNDSSNNSSDLI